MNREVQHIGLGFVKATPRKRAARPHPRQWLGKQIERFGRRLQHRPPGSGTLRQQKMVSVQN